MDTDYETLQKEFLEEIQGLNEKDFIAVCTRYRKLYDWSNDDIYITLKGATNAT